MGANAAGVYQRVVRRPIERTPKSTAARSRAVGSSAGRVAIRGGSDSSGPRSRFRHSVLRGLQDKAEPSIQRVRGAIAARIGRRSGRRDRGCSPDSPGSTEWREYGPFAPTPVPGVMADKRAARPRPAAGRGQTRRAAATSGRPRPTTARRRAPGSPPRRSTPRRSTRRSRRRSRAPSPDRRPRRDPRETSR